MRCIGRQKRLALSRREFGFAGGFPLKPAAEMTPKAPLIGPCRTGGRAAGKRRDGREQQQTKQQAETSLQLLAHLQADAIGSAACCRGEGGIGHESSGVGLDECSYCVIRIQMASFADPASDCRCTRRQRSRICHGTASISASRRFLWRNNIVSSGAWPSSTSTEQSSRLKACSDTIPGQ